MKLVRAIIQPHRLDMIREALLDKGVTGMTVFEARGFGRQKGHKEIYRGTEYTVNFQPKIVADMVVPDGNVEEVCDVIIQTAKSGNIGDGKIFVMNIEKTTRIRTGETGPDAL